ncbi:MAG: LPS export ABC transporter periplasmic protein LptC [Proteobacteria bacterium]|nr:LPS export ABC transporter periplasmic protein LptC [Pseudomonadota bacterium]
MQRIAVGLALVALIVAVVVMSGGQRETAMPAGTGEEIRDPGYSALDAHLVQTGADGQPRYTLDAQRIQQEPGGGKVDMQQVRLHLRDDNGNPWTAQAQRGQLAQDSGIVQLDGSVVVTGIVPGTQDDTQITTEHLAFDTHAQVLATPTDTTISMSGRQLSAHGMTASLKDRHVQLESAVHGTFLPH